jgi:hypothetical protein
MNNKRKRPLTTVLNLTQPIMQTNSKEELTYEQSYH